MKFDTRDTNNHTILTLFETGNAPRDGKKEVLGINTVSFNLKCPICGKVETILESLIYLSSLRGT